MTILAPFAKGDLVKVSTPTKSWRRHEVALIDKIHHEDESITIKLVNNMRSKQRIRDIQRIKKTKLSTMELHSHTRNSNILDAPPPSHFQDIHNLKCDNVMQSSLKYRFVDNREAPLINYLRVKIINLNCFLN